MKSLATEGRRTHHTKGQPASVGGMVVLSAVARLGNLERERIKLRNRLTAWMLNLSSEESGIELLDRIDFIESEQDSLRAALNDKLGDPLAA